MDLSNKTVIKIESDASTDSVQGDPVKSQHQKIVVPQHVHARINQDRELALLQNKSSTINGPELSSTLDISSTTNVEMDRITSQLNNASVSTQQSASVSTINSTVSTSVSVSTPIRTVISEPTPASGGSTPSSPTSVPTSTNSSTSTSTNSLPFPVPTQSMPPPLPRFVPKASKSTFFLNMNTSNYCEYATSADGSSNRTNTVSDLDPNSKLTEAFRRVKETECIVFAYNQALLQSIPSQVGELRFLKDLNFSFNKLKSLPETMIQLTNLKNLNLSENDFDHVPLHVVQHLTQLTQLNMSGNRLRRLPSEIGNLTQLLQLHLGNNKLTTLPSSIGKLRKLQILHLQKNQFTALPSTIGRLESLISLYLQDNMLTLLPSEICQLSSVKNLFVQNNKLDHLPPSIGMLTQMWWFNVSNNFLNSFPSSLGRLSKTLTDFMYQGNPLKDVPTFLHSDSRALMVFLEREQAPDVIVSTLVLPHDLKTMVNSQAFSDIVAVVNGIEIYMHKCVLEARRATYFIDHLFPTLSTSHQEDQQGELDNISKVVLDLNVSLFLEILEFIYTGNSQKILPDSSKYQYYIHLEKADTVSIEEKEKRQGQISGSSGSKNQLSLDFKSLFNNPAHSDIEFEVDGKIIYGHKAVICCRCSPMAAMFNSYSNYKELLSCGKSTPPPPSSSSPSTVRFQEYNQKRIKVCDIAYDIFVQVMLFIYTGECQINGENAVDLLVVANLYQLQRLKEMCEKVIEQGVDDDNRIQLLQFSNTYHAIQLEELCAHAFVTMRDKDYDQFTSSLEFYQLNQEIQLLIKRKRDCRNHHDYTNTDNNHECVFHHNHSNSIEEKNYDRALTDDHKKNKLSIDHIYTTTTTTIGSERERESSVCKYKYQPRYGSMNSVFNFQGPLDFDFSEQTDAAASDVFGIFSSLDGSIGGSIGSNLVFNATTNRNNLKNSRDRKNKQRKKNTNNNTGNSLDQTISTSASTSPSQSLSSSPSSTSMSTLPSFCFEPFTIQQ